MKWNAKKAMKDLNKQIKLTEAAKLVRQEIKDFRYNEPKGKPKASEEQIDEVLANTEIYRLAKEHILKAQRGQIGYGLDKYPEPLNADTWSMIETIDHIIDESVDKLHYLVMLRVKMVKELEEEKASESTPSYPDDQSWKTYVNPNGRSISGLYPYTKVKIDEYGNIAGFDKDLICGGIDKTVYTHSTFREEFKPNIDIKSWVAINSCETQDLKVNYILNGEEHLKSVTLDSDMLKDISYDSSNYCKDDMDAIRYAIEEAIRDERF